MAIQQTLGGPGGVDEKGRVFESLCFLCDTRLESLNCGPATWQGLPQKPGGRGWAREPSGKYKVTVVYSAIEDEDPENPRNFEWLPTRSEEPIESHPLFDALMRLYGGTLGEDKKVLWPLYMPDTALNAYIDGLSGGGFGTSFGGTGGFSSSSGGVGQFSQGGGLDAGSGSESGRKKNPMFGRESYVLKSLILRWSFTSKSYPHKWVGLDNTVVKSVPGGHKTPQEKDWLVSVEGVRTLQGPTGELYDVVIDFHLSEKGGWPPAHHIVQGI